MSSRPEAPPSSGAGAESPTAAFSASGFGSARPSGPPRDPAPVEASDVDRALIDASEFDRSYAAAKAGGPGTADGVAGTALLGRTPVSGRTPGGRGSDGGSAGSRPPDVQAPFVPSPDRPSWEESDEPGHTHDPHEVTIQLDGAGRQLEDWLVQQADGAPGAAARDGSDGPVFVDESGRRSRTFRRLGVLVGLACAVYAVVIVATLMSGNSSAPWIPVPGQEEEQPAGQVETTPLPTDSTGPSGSAEGTPSPGTTARDGTAPSPGASSSPGASGGAVRPGTSSGTGPSSRATTSAPAKGSKDADPPKSSPVADPPTPADPSGATSPGPSASAASGSAANVAGGTLEPAPVEPPGTTSSPSPENIV
ncbi:hypothetical protein ACFY93_31410 [Streptomyces sp. NPDC008313]|uniref:hypothetical protein n=1 Tax=Streptomyces sp. NPDC008313 TaxID=3364826 RepID=UPI0036EA1CEE